MNSVEWFIGLKILHIGALIFWLGPSLGAWFMLMALRQRDGEFTPVTFPQSQYHFQDEISMLSRQLGERHWRQII